jgi:hypothetical protein
MIVVMCCRVCSQSVITRWATLAEARDYAEIVPCGDRCAGDHLVSWRESGHACCEFVTAPAVPSLEAQLRKLYKRTQTTIPVELYPHPTRFNEPHTRYAPG